ncbi:hypothetical protein EVAR_41679_1 [Eumeta japonica]|uniref:Uncharacterized protein n=1 Tax=Eumeta variegata TaxID=151549 RepID=A0A4C1VQY2_EUMVA|nr:hypothetical protein EVAR_41679_1 [Eumeta japonica]
MAKWKLSHVATQDSTREASRVGGTGSALDVKCSGGDLRLTEHVFFPSCDEKELGVYSASPCAAGQHARVLTARDLLCGGSLKGILSAQEVTGTPARVGPVRYLDAGAV